MPLGRRVKSVMKEATEMAMRVFQGRTGDDVVTSIVFFVNFVFIFVGDLLGFI